MITLNQEKFDILFKKKLIENLTENHKEKLIEFGKSQNIDFVTDLETLSIANLNDLYSELELVKEYLKIELKSSILFQLKN
ncbi:hypothetical protein B5M19_02440 [Mesomycoplasma hyopneumoniae]|uniref:Uncharacterized protein n=3 Tax=Mesomycoplasma hyopneumoniae TaxID=2099 RepID=E4QSM5_MESH1|nr:hypothetical protein [Mesomycoplasma hyopneumoniae]ADQ90434.1 Putative uncharacterized protein [Mesomycoplasma hyopneumoniae 168]AGM22002.1 hypothetical protein MHP168L_222 [Mesomycoplasma hyopneumoniae 168-L]ASU13935.1 hypothetical protein CIB43_00018 [Mesomycoplasma hyopneumoniae]MXR09993.1 hypothetical protein [Mesomycoplasma hyopneumoniae]OWY73837.1 hypothetical protein B5M19_02440 [Mesomycoplasma hyopneumoniae]